MNNDEVYNNYAKHNNMTVEDLHAKFSNMSIEDIYISYYEEYCRLKYFIPNLNVYIENEDSELFHYSKSCKNAKTTIHFKNVMFSKKPCPECCSDFYINYILNPLKERYSKNK